MQRHEAVLALAMMMGGLSACAGNAGNPNGAAYATDPGGTMAAPPGNAGEVTYDPYAPTPAPDFMRAPATGGTVRQ